MSANPELPSITLRERVPVSRTAAERSVEKARALALPVLDLAGPVADPAPVSPKVVTDPDEWAYGRFMLAWLDPAPPVRRVCHLPDAAFFLKLLARTYAPVFEKRPDLARLLENDSRPEMSLTNDVLQIQLQTLDPGYSMIRHHSLMLFQAALWLDEPDRTGWLDLYDEIVDYVDLRPGGRPGLEDLAAIEVGAFEDFVSLAPRTLDDVSAAELLAGEAELERVLEYQLCAAAAIGLLWRSYRATPQEARTAWLERQYTTGYISSDYLVSEWTTS